jgi:hypothetical protein
MATGAFFASRRFSLTYRICGEGRRLGTDRRSPSGHLDGYAGILKTDAEKLGGSCHCSWRIGQYRERKAEFGSNPIINQANRKCEFTNPSAALSPARLTIVQSPEVFIG